MNEFDALVQRADNLLAGAKAEHDPLRKAIFANMAGRFYEDAIKVAPSADVAPYKNVDRAYAFAETFRAKIATEEPTDETVYGLLEPTEIGIEVTLIVARMAKEKLDSIEESLVGLVMLARNQGGELYGDDARTYLNLNGEFVLQLKKTYRLHAIAQPYLSEQGGREEREMRSYFDKIKAVMQRNDISEI